MSSCSRPARATASSRSVSRPRSRSSTALPWTGRTEPCRRRTSTVARSTCRSARRSADRRRSTPRWSSAATPPTRRRGRRRAGGGRTAEQAYARSTGAFLREPLREPSPLTHAFVAAAKRWGIPPSADLNAPDNSGVGLVPVSQRRGRRWSVADGYLRPALRRPNLTVATGARAARILLDRGRAVGVAYRLDGREEEAPARREVIVSCGTINSPQLLLLSGIGPRAAIEGVGLELVHELPGVGRNLRDHLANGIFCRTHDAVTLFTAESLRNLARWLVRRRGPLCSNVGEAVAFVERARSLPHRTSSCCSRRCCSSTKGSAAARGRRDDRRSCAPAGKRGRVLLAPPIRTTRHSSTRGTCPIRGTPACSFQACPAGAADRGPLPLARHISEELAPRGGGGVGRGHSGSRARALADALPPSRHVPARNRRRRGGRPAAARSRCRGTSRRRRLGDAALARGHTNWPTVMIAERAVELIRAAEPS